MRQDGKEKLRIRRELVTGKSHNVFVLNEFTLLEFLIVIAIIVILAGILLPALSKTREITKRSECANNIRNLMLGGIMAYADDYSEWVFYGKYATYGWNSSTYWNGILMSPKNPSAPGRCMGYVPVTYGTGIARGIFHCPSENETASAEPGTDFGLGVAPFYSKPKYDSSHSLLKLYSFQNPSRTLYMADSYPCNAIDISSSMIEKKPKYRHRRSANVSFCDGHIEALSYVQLPSMGTPSFLGSLYPWSGQ